ncbi:MAG: single-stranded DNA-binding protein [Leucobacter sp.]
MSNQISIVGTIATDPRYSAAESRVPYCTFRVASNERRFHREKNEWIDCGTNWYTINSFRSLAEHAKDSFSKGDRVIVNGRLRIRQWESKEKSGTSVEIDADALGHDVRWGVSRFTKQRTPEQQRPPTSSAHAGTTDDNSAYGGDASVGGTASVTALNAPAATPDVASSSGADEQQTGSFGSPQSRWNPAASEAGSEQSGEARGEDGFLPAAA